MGRQRNSETSVGETSKELVSSETRKSSEDSTPVKYHPVDKGWAWIIMIGVFVIHFLTTGYLRSFGLLFVEFQRHFQSSSTITAAMNGVQMLSYSLTTFVTMNFLIKHISVRTSCLLGCCLQLASLVSNSLVTDIRYLVLTHGVLFGSGQALMYCPCMVILSEYFDKKRPIAMVFATGGVSAGGVTMPLLIRLLVDTYGLKGGLLILGGVIFQQAVFMSFFTPPSDYTPPASEDSRSGSFELSSKSASDGSVSKNGQHFGDIGFQDALEDKNNGIDKSFKNTTQTCASVYDHNKVEQNCAGKNQAQRLTVSTKNKTSRHRTISAPSPDEDSMSVPTTNTGRHFSSSYNTKHDIETNAFVLGVEDCKPTSTTTSKDSLNGTSPQIIIQEIAQKDADSNLLGLPKSPRGPLHPMSFQSDTLARAMSTSSVDVLGSVQHISITGSIASIRRRGRQSSSFERLPLSVSKLDRRHPSSQDGSEDHCLARLSRCRVPEIMRRPAFWLTAVFFSCGGVASALPFVFLPPLTQSMGLDETKSSFLLIVSAITEMIGRLIPGLILHCGYMRPTTVVIPSMFLCGLLLQFVSFFRDFVSLMVLSCFMGLFTGAFWAMQVLVVIEIIGMASLGQAFGFYSIILGFSIGSSFPVSGAMVDAFGDFTVPYHYFGALYLMASLSMVLIQFTRRAGDLDVSSQENDSDDDEGLDDNDNGSHIA